MAKPNLTSIFTSTNQYSVLKLLKALCDAVDNIDYADNTEFTKFKEQINSAITSLNSADDNLQEQIDNNNGLINDVSAQISVIERPDTHTTVVNKGLSVKDNGDVTVVRNLEVGGTTKLNGGLEPIHEYKLGDDYALQVFFEKPDTLTGDNYFIGFGYILDDERSPMLAMFGYRVENENIVADSFGALDYLCNTYELRQDGIIINDIPRELINKQPRLYRHVINVSNGTAPNSYSGYIVYISTSSFNVNSLQALTRLTKATSGFRYPLSGLCIQGGVTGNPTPTNYNVLVYDGIIWHVYSGGTVADSPAITSVTDIVTSL